MNLLYFSLFGLGVFISVLLGGKKFRSTALYALAIGGAVNANYFHSGNYPIDIFGLSFGIDSIIYTLFIFSIIIMLLQYGRKQAYLLSVSSIIAIMFAAFYELIAKILSQGYQGKVWYNFFDFLASSISSIIVIVLLIETIEFLRNKTRFKNQYLLTIVGLLIATLINTPIFYTFECIVNGTPDNILELVLTSYLGKLLAMIFALLTLYLINLYDKKVVK